MSKSRVRLQLHTTPFAIHHDLHATVLLQAMKEDPPADAKCRDKFLVQSVAISADQEFPNITQIVCC